MVTPSASPATRSAFGTPDAVRLERDRHVAFAFAAADLLVETSNTGLIEAASGAAQSIVGHSIAELIGRRFETVIAAHERSLVRRLLKRVAEVGRIDPVPLDIERPDGTSASVLFGGCCLPNLPKRLFLSVTLLPVSLTVALPGRDQSTGLLNVDSLREVAVRNADLEGQARLKLVHLDGLAGAARQLAAGRAALLMAEIGAALRSESLGGDAAGRIEDDSFGFVTRGADDLKRDATLLQDLGDVLVKAGVKDGRVTSSLSGIDLCTEGLVGGDVGRSIAYVMSTFAKSHGADLAFDSLAAGLAAAVADAVSRVAFTRAMISDGSFALVYQPVVAIQTQALHHYEALCRFSGGQTTFETIGFSEDMGLIAELDLNVCKRTIEALKQHPTVNVAVNISGRSVQNEGFRRSFAELVVPLASYRDRLLFELTESAIIEDLEDAAAFLRYLRKLGHSICIDDFGAGAAAYSYLRRFDVDFVKIDGPFLKAALQGRRERALIKSICVLASEIGCRVIGEMIETGQEAAVASEMGIEFGQGWLFGKPISEFPKIRPLDVRRGTTETLS